MGISALKEHTIQRVQAITAPSAAAGILNMMNLFPNSKTEHMFIPAVTAVPSILSLTARADIPVLTDTTLPLHLLKSVKRRATSAVKSLKSIMYMNMRLSLLTVK